MKLVKSELILEDFFIVNSDYDFIEPQSDDINLRQIANDYYIDIDFIVRDIKSEENRFLIFTKIDINNKEDHLPGYSLFTEGVSIFSFNTKSKLSEKEKSDFLWTSGVSISINNLRNYISAITSYCPFGKYTLPSVDLTSLLNTKRKELNKKGKSKRD
tara:strand:- start:12784 stop:13257 length:474 start_codon:yes stop_codon:yes gene_type:complete